MQPISPSGVPSSNPSLQPDIPKIDNPHIARSEISSSLTSAPSNLLQTALMNVDAKPKNHVFHVPSIAYNPDEIKKLLKPGDIILSYYPKATDRIAAMLHAGQKLSKLTKDLTDEDSHLYVHAAIYLEDGQLVEAVKEGITMNSIEGDRFKLNQGDAHEYHIFRFQDPEIAQEAGNIAKRLATDQINSYPYRKTLAIGSFFQSTQLSKDAMKRYMKGVYCAETNTPPMDAKGIRGFYCSYLTLWCYQAAESKKNFRELNRILEEMHQSDPNSRWPPIELPDLSQFTTAKEKAKALDDWALDIADRYEDLLPKYIDLKIDSKNLQAQQLAVFLNKEKLFFNPICNIVAPAIELQSTQFPEV